MKILYVSTVSGTINAFLLPHILRLIELGYSVDIACHITRPIDKILLENGCKVYDLGFQRSPLSKENIQAYKDLREIIIKNKYTVVHTHTPVASVLVRMACRKMKDIKVIYTAHGFHFYTGAPIKNWIVYYTVEKILSKYTDVLITINSEDYTRANRYFKAKKIMYIPGVGLDVQKFGNISPNYKLREVLGIPSNSFLLISVGELNENKNHETIIRAIANIDLPNIYYIVCGDGPKYEILQQLINNLKLGNRVKLLGLRHDIGMLLKISDLFVFPSYREGLSVALMEAMACGLPVVCSDIRGNRDLIDKGKGGLLVNPKDQAGFIKAILRMYGNSKLRYRMGGYNKNKINSFNIENVLKEIECLYRSFE